MALKTITQAALTTLIDSACLYAKSDGREGYKPSLSGYNLQTSAVTITNYSCMPGGTFTKTRFNTLNLVGCDFSKSNARYTTFNNCNLSTADFSGADLYGANFTGANLTNVDFSGAAMQNAILTGATLTGARFDNCDRTGVVY